MKTGLMAKLREHTRAEHHCLEKASYLSTPNLDRSAYTAWIARLYGFVAPLEEQLARIEGWDAVGIDLTKRRKTPLLEQDLEALGLNRLARQALPHCRDLPDIDSMAHALGCLYVFEGATLGGRLIAAHLRSALPEVAEQAMAYHSSYGEAVPAIWRAFGEHIEAFARRQDLDSEIIGAARSCFRSLECWIVAMPRGRA